MDYLRPSPQPMIINRRHLILFRVRMFVLCAFLLSLTATLAVAQQPATATLSGRIVDPQEAVVAGVRAVVTHQATGVKRETTSNDEGVYVLTNLPPGNYDVRFEGKG